MARIDLPFLLPSHEALLELTEAGGGKVDDLGTLREFARAFHLPSAKPTTNTDLPLRQAPAGIIDEYRKEVLDLIFGSPEGLRSDQALRGLPMARRR
jgi:hypothetical protein